MVLRSRFRSAALAALAALVGACGWPDEPRLDGPVLLTGDTCFAVAQREWEVDPFSGPFPFRFGLVLRRVGGRWRPSGWLPHPHRRDAHPDGFGSALALLADGTLAVAAPLYGGGTFFFRPAADGWAEVGALRDARSYELAASGARLLVWIAWGVSPPGAQVWERAGGTWSRAAELETPPSPSAASLALSGDVAVLASDYWPAVLVFEHGEDGWQRAAELERPPAGLGAIALDGATLLVCDRHLSVGVYERRERGWAPTDVLAPPLEPPDRWPRAALALDGDTALVGGARAVHAFERGASGWSRSGELAPVPWSLGGSLALDGNTAVVATPEALCFFERETDGWRATDRVDVGALERFAPPPIVD